MSVSGSSGYRESEVRPAKNSRVGLALGIWLSGVFAVSLFGRVDAATHRSFGMVLLGAAIVWPLAYFMMGRGAFIPRTPKPGPLIGLGVFLLFCALSSFGSPIGLESIGYTVMTLFSCWIALQFNTNLDESQLLKGLKIYAVLMVILLAWFAYYDYVPGERLGNGRRILNPNTVGLVGMSAFLATFSIEAILARGLLMGVLGAVIVLTGSRAALLASVMGWLLIFWVRGRTAKIKTTLIALGFIGVLLLVALLYTEAVLRGFEQLLSLRDRDRGIDSGATGRFEAWAATWNLFLSHPILGVGFRAHEQFKAVEASSHNGYLSLLSEIGVVGFLGALWLEITGLLHVWKATKDPGRLSSHTILLGFGCAYMFLGMFERYLINVGNPTSLLFLLCILRPKGVLTKDPRIESVSCADSLPEQPQHADYGKDRHQGGVVSEQSGRRRTYELLQSGREVTRS